MVEKAVFGSTIRSRLKNKDFIFGDQKKGGLGLKMLGLKTILKYMNNKDKATWANVYDINWATNKFTNTIWAK